MTGQLEGASKNFEKSEEYKEAMITEGVTQAKSQAAADSVNKRHAKTNDAKAEIIEDYKKNKNDFVSKKDAANKYEHRFPLLSYRTIYDILKGL